MKKLQKSDLKEGDIYVSNSSYGSYEYLNKHSLSGRGFGLDLTLKNDFRSDWYLSYVNIREATPEEKHWLETCIKADKFVSYEEAMKTFVKYYKIIVSKIAMNYNNNVIHEERIVFGHYQGNNRIIKTIETGKHRIDSTIDVLYGKIGEQKVCFDMTALQPSTKEAYDAQFVVKEPEFVLPEKWYIKARLLNDDQLQKLVDYLKILNKSSIYCVENIKKHFPIIGSDKGSHYITSDTDMLYYSEITFDQFEQYILKDEKEIVTVKATVETKSKFINNNTVETSEGSIFKVGDLVTPFENSSPNKGKKFKITGFRWNNSQTEICAITDLHKPYGIGVEKLEIYLESKVKIVEDFVLPEKWFVNITTYEQVAIVNRFRDRSLSKPGISITSELLCENKNSWTARFRECIKKDYTEITFEQFKKYVLNEKKKYKLIILKNIYNVK